MNNLNFQSVVAKALIGVLYYQFAPQSLHQGALVTQVSAYAMSTMMTAALRSTQEEAVIRKVEVVSPFAVMGLITFFQDISWRVYLFSTAILGGVQVLIDYTLPTFHQGSLLSFLPSHVSSSTEPLWTRSSDGSVLLNKLPALRFDDKWILTKDDKGRLEGTLEGSSSAKFSLSKSIMVLHEGVVPSLQFDCPALQPLLKSGAIATTGFHTSAKGTVNLPEELRDNFHLPESARSSCLCYPVHLDPDRAEATIREIQSNKDIPSFMVGLLLYGGFAFFDEFDELVAVKAFTESETTTETLSTLKTVSGDLLPDKIRRGFEEGVLMTSGTGEWAIYGGAIPSTAANKVTVPKLQANLSHYTYLSPDQYALSSLAEVAPHGAFVYRLKSGLLQVVPIGKGELASTKSVQNLSEADANKLRLTLKLILENPTPLFQAFKGNLKRFFSYSYDGIEFEGKSYSAKGNQIFIRDGQTTYAMTLDEDGKITAAKKTVYGGMFSSDQEETFSSDKIPVELVRDLETFYERLMSHCYATGSRGHEVLLYITKEGPEHAPLNYLRVLTEAITKGKSPRTRIFDLVQGKFVGDDAQGLSRTFITHLVKGMTRSPHFYNKDGKGAFPHHKGSLSVSDRTFYDQVGTLLAFCHESGGNYVTGHFFHDTFFPSLKAFSRKELRSRALPSLSNERKLVLYQALIGKEPAYDKLFEILGSPDAPSLDDELLEIYVEGFLPDPTPKMQDVKKNWHTHWKQEILQGFLADIEKKDAYNLEALHAIGHSLVSRISYGALYDPKLSDHIQGVVDPKVVARSIKYNGDNAKVQEKVQWLRDWVNSTTLENVKQFLEFVSGTRGLPPGQLIKINQNESASPLLKTSTCFWTIYMPYGRVDAAGHHSTSTKFIQRVEDSIKNSAYQQS